VLVSVLHHSRADLKSHEQAKMRKIVSLLANCVIGGSQSTAKGLHRRLEP